MAESAHLTVRQIMNPSPVRLEPDRTVREAITLMTEHRVGAVLIADTAGKLLGIFTERDFLRQSTQHPSDWQNICIRDWMSPYPYTIQPSAGWEEAVTSMERLRVRHLPVVENGSLAGILTTRQLVAHRANHLNILIGERTSELRNANDSLMARDSEITHYMKAAAKLQKKLMLPQSPPDWPEIGCSVFFRPLDPLGGDYYDFARPDDEHLGILIADASGHGVPAAMVAIMTWLAFTEAAKTTSKPGEVLTAMNNRLLGLADERFVTAFYGVFNRRTRQFTYSNAGHPFPLRHVKESGKIHPLASRGFMLGIMPDEVYADKSIILAPGDRLLFYTDGIVDLRDDRGESFGTERLSSCLGESSEQPASTIVTWIKDELNHFCAKNGNSDDTTMIVSEIR
ncbi:PP2C family protein-serine/threonine phosphatase [Zavarzinella formosa]|uniref:PP2C family protein-serine/threonine phosphatase n=1 Tax=Zavarzinella formosa TaxID=360055 RepID=UPI00031AF469|nr:SpoIIE family protein phosphatase [Zavarzinella formosa]